MPNGPACGGARWPNSRRYPQVACKFSGLLTEAPASAGAAELRPVWNHLLYCFGPERLMWGSDWPVLNLASDYATWVGVADSLIGELAARRAGRSVLARHGRTLLRPGGDAVMNPIVSIRNLGKSFPGVRALDRAQFELLPGEVHALMGENGAGKSTLMKVLAGVYRKDEGEMLLDGQPIEVDSPRAAQHLGIGIIHQELNLMNHLTAAQNIFIGREPRRFGLFLDEARAQRVEGPARSSTAAAPASSTRARPSANSPWPSNRW